METKPSTESLQWEQKSRGWPCLELFCFDFVFAVFVFNMCGFFHTCVGIPKQVIFSKPDLKMFLTSDMAWSPLKWKIGRLWSKSFKKNTKYRCKYKKYHPLYGKRHTCLVFYKHVWLFPHTFVFGKCLIKATHVWFLPLRKNTTWQWFFPHMCAFIEPLQGRPVEWWIPHRCIFYQTCVFFTWESYIKFIKCNCCQRTGTAATLKKWFLDKCLIVECPSIF